MISAVRAANGLLSAALAAILLAAGGCSSPPSGPSTTPASRPGPTVTPAPDERDGAPLRAYPSCGTAPTLGPEQATQAAHGIVLPPGTIVADSSVEGKIVNISGYVELTPVQVRQFYTARKDLRFFTIEDEVFESEMFFEQPDGKRAYVKAMPACSTASRLIIVIAPAT